MFTGIIEEVGTVKLLLQQGETTQIVISAKEVLKGTKLGDSIAVNGVCLTVTKFSADGFCADVMGETLRRSSLGTLKKGSKVNLERAMAADGRFGGHIVSGHIDGTGEIASVSPEGNAVWYRILAPQKILDGIVEKGSIAIDGISLTVAEVTEQEKYVMFTLMLQDCSRNVCGYNIYSWNQIKAAASKSPENISTAILYLLHNLDILKDTANTRTGYVLKSLGYIEEHFTENISLDMAAENMGISSFYLSRLLTQQLQISFVDLLTSARINRAIELIRNQKAVVRNIGIKCGYQSAAYFYKAFKKNTGMTVGEMREFLNFKNTLW